MKPANGKIPETTTSSSPPTGKDTAAIEKLVSAHERIRRELRQVVVGQDEVVEQLLTALFAGGHCILEGVPGLAKTLLVSTLASILDLSFNRIQFTPDLMPSDITGTEIIQQDRESGQRFMKFMPGPIFANVVLADEINRTPPKTQAALLESMQEHQVTAGGQRHQLEAPFFVLATQNPIEQQGTYPLPEAQLDRFMFKIFVDYPSYQEEYQVAERSTTPSPRPPERILNKSQILELQEVVRRIPIAPSVIRYALDLVRHTRPTRRETSHSEETHPTQLPEIKPPDFVERLVSWGAGPRAVQYLILAGKVRAALAGRFQVSFADIQAAAGPVLRHRLVLNYSAEAEGYTADRLIRELLQTVKSGSTAITEHESYQQILST